MGHGVMRYCLFALAGLLLAFLLYSCASMGNPNGGPYDETPPRFLSSKPLPGQTNYTGSKIEILFDELIQIDNPMENVIITPPQLMMPIVRATGRKAEIELRDSLKANMTYTIDFTNSLSDNNEKNVLENFFFAFSTGNVIDTLEVSGLLLNAENLEPMPGITIGLHSNLDDSAFVKEPFLRTSRTNDKGQFIIRNVAEGTYRIYALNDINRDYRFDQPSEDIAFDDLLVIPAFEFTTRMDTIWKDSLTVDTVLIVPYTRFTPDDICLFLFKEDFARQYLLRAERPEDRLGVLRFNAPLDTIPVPKPLNFTPTDSLWYFPQVTEEGKTINYWLTDPALFSQDTLSVELTYPRSDSLNILRAQTDTLHFFMRGRQDRRVSRNESEQDTIINFLELTSNIRGGAVNIFDTIHIEFKEPVLSLNADMFILEQKVDTLWHPIEFELFPDSTNSLAFFVNHKWKYDTGYRMEIDSTAIHSAYGKWNDFFSLEFSIKKEEEYGHLYIALQGVDTTAFVELLNASDSPVRKAKVRDDGGALFMDLAPGKYYARLIIDENENGKWDTGNYAEKRQPEEVYYCPTVFDIRNNFQIEHTWNVLERPIDKQKPMEITKNKPKEATRPQRDYRNEQQNSSRSGSGGMGLPF